MSSIAQILLDKWQGNTPGLREDYRQKLSHGVWIVEFVKVDGTPTIMECTLDPKYLPPADPKEQGGNGNEAVLGVYSLDRGGWRSFRVDNVTRFYPKPEML